MSRQPNQFRPWSRNWRVGKIQVKKTIIIILIFLIILSAVGLTYLNNVVLPRTVKVIIIKAIEGQTQKKVTLGSLRINIFKGLVLENLNIYDKDEAIVSVKEASCIFWIWGFIQKKIIIPSINLNSCRIFLERRKDGSFNLAGFSTPKQEGILKQPVFLEPSVAINPKPKPPRGFSVEVYRVNIFNSTIHFKDSSFDKPFNQDLDDVRINLYLSLPSVVRFKASAQIPGNLKPNIALNGEFKFPQEELSSTISIKNISPDKFSVYCQSSGIGIKEGLADALIFLKFKDSVLGLDCQIKASGLNVSKDKISLSLNSQINASLKYSLKEGQVKYFGKAIFKDSVISGLDFVESINGISAAVNFDNNGLSSDNILATIFAIPVKAKLKLNNFGNPVLNIDLVSNIDLAKAQGLLKDKFNFILPGLLNGNAGFLLNIATDRLNTGAFNVNGYLDFVNAVLKLDKINNPITEINGRLEFTLNQLKAKEVSFKYQGLSYKLSTLVSNFQSPDVALELLSEALKIKADFTIVKNKVNISELSGRYLNSDFNATGNFDTLSSQADISGAVGINLGDLGRFLPKFKEQIDKIMPKGIVQAKFNFNGDVKDIKDCAIEAQVLSPQVSLYGFKGEGFSCHYNQHSGIIDIPSLSFSFYGGTVNLFAKANLNSKNLPYSVNLFMQGVKIEELKLDTPAKDKDITGIIQGELKANGLSNDLSKLIGAGSLAITKGKLWELDLFKGLGKLLFAENFAGIVFYEGSCNFVIQDSYCYTTDLMLKSNMVNLSGPAKVGFNNSVDASLSVNIINEAIPLSGTFKDVTTAIIGKFGKFATISITGTLKEPKYKFKPVMKNIIKGLSDILESAMSKN